MTNPFGIEGEQDSRNFTMTYNLKKADRRLLVRIQEAKEMIVDEYMASSFNKLACCGFVTVEQVDSGYLIKLIEEK